jgi:hypothetical protein
VRKIRASKEADASREVSLRAGIGRGKLMFRDGWPSAALDRLSQCPDREAASVIAPELPAVHSNAKAR